MSPAPRTDRADRQDENVPRAGAKGIGSGLQPGGTKPSTETVAGTLGRIDTPGAQTVPTERPTGNDRHVNKGSRREKEDKE
jgi:hypothetical protein